MANESVKVNEVVRMFETSETEDVLNALYSIDDIEEIEAWINDKKEGMITAILRVIENIDYLVDSKTEKPIDVNIFCHKYLGLDGMRIKTFLTYLKNGRFTTKQLVSFFDRIVVNPQFIMMEVTV